MKNITKHLVIIFSILIHINFTKGQENQIKLNNFKHEDSLKLQLQKHGLDLYAMPANWSLLPTFQTTFIERFAFWTKWLYALWFCNHWYHYFGNWKWWFGKITWWCEYFWIHGLNGTTESWAVAAKATEYGVMKNNEVVFPARKANSYRGLPSSNSNPVQLYSEDLGILSASQDVEDYMDSEVPITDRTSKDFIIAHSQGGIVGREWLRQSVN